MAKLVMGTRMVFHSRAHVAELVRARVHAVRAELSSNWTGASPDATRARSDRRSPVQGDKWRPPPIRPRRSPSRDLYLHVSLHFPLPFFSEDFE
jgi:hypothetical protein